MTGRHQQKDSLRIWARHRLKDSYTSRSTSARGIARSWQSCGALRHQRESVNLEMEAEICEHKIGEDGAGLPAISRFKRLRSFHKVSLRGLLSHNCSDLKLIDKANFSKLISNQKSEKARNNRVLIISVYLLPVLVGVFIHKIVHPSQFSFQLGWTNLYFKLHADYPINHIFLFE